MVFCDIGFHKPLNAIIAPKEAQNPAQPEIFSRHGCPD